MKVLVIVCGGCNAFFGAHSVDSSDDEDLGQAVRDAAVGGFRVALFDGPVSVPTECVCKKAPPIVGLND